jgi:hypothetical protein
MENCSCKLHGLLSITDNFFATINRIDNSIPLMAREKVKQDSLKVFLDAIAFLSMLDWPRNWNRRVLARSRGDFSPRSRPLRLPRANSRLNIVRSVIAGSGIKEANVDHAYHTRYDLIEDYLRISRRSASCVKAHVKNARCNLLVHAS